MTARRRIQHVGVVIPARDEADHIALALASIDVARVSLSHDVTTACVVVADGCVDRTAELCRAWTGAMGPPTVIEIADRCVGAARATGTDWVLANTARADSDVWIANTDADSTVPADWLAQQLVLAEQGVAAVAGIVKLADWTDRHVLDRFTETYVLGADGTHEHVHGANLGCRGDAYVDAGGWRDLVTAEDHDLWRRLGRRHTRVSSTSVVVTTSARLTGRAPAGFAGELVKHVEASRSVA